MRRVPTKSKPGWKWLSPWKHQVIPHLSVKTRQQMNHSLLGTCLWATFWTAYGVMNIVNRKALSRKCLPTLRAPSLWTLWKTESQRLSRVLFQWKKVPSQGECSQPAALFWTVSTSAVLDMLTSFQLTQAEKTNYEFTTEYRTQHSMRKWNTPIYLQRLSIQKEHNG